MGCEKVVLLWHNMPLVNPLDCTECIVGKGDCATWWWCMGGHDDNGISYKDEIPHSWTLYVLM
jgi:hypothetical protein